MYVCVRCSKTIIAKTKKATIGSVGRAIEATAVSEAIQKRCGRHDETNTSVARNDVQKNIREVCKRMHVKINACFIIKASPVHVPSHHFGGLKSGTVVAEPGELAPMPISQLKYFRNQN